MAGFGQVFGGADVHRNVTDLAMHPVQSDTGSLLDADLVSMPGGDEHVQTIGSLTQAHADAAAGVQAARGAFPFVTSISDAGDRLTGMGAQAGRAAVKGAQVAAKIYDGLDFQPTHDVEALHHQVRSIYRPGA